MPKQWLLIQTKPRDELRAAQHLESQGCNIFCPQVPVEKIFRGKRITKIEPLFPGYLFIENPSADSAITYTSIRSTRGVSKVVRFGVDYTLLPDELIQQVKLRVETLSGEDEALASVPKQGDTVQITEGPFQGLEAIYQQPDGEMRSMLLINLLHQQVAVSVDNTAIQ